MVDYWRKLLESKDGREKTFNGKNWKILHVKAEKDSIKGTINIGAKGAHKCIITVFKSGTMLLATAKSFSFDVVLDFASNILIPISRNIIKGKETEESIGIQAVEIRCKHCGKLFVS